MKILGVLETLPHIIFSAVAIIIATVRPPVSTGGASWCLVGLVAQAGGVGERSWSSTSP